MLDETWSFGVLGRTGRGLTEAQNMDTKDIDMLIGSLAGPLCSGGGFCAGSKDVVEHQRITSTAYTYSAALPAMLATTASETLNMIQTNPDILVQCRENIKAMRTQLDPRSDWVICTSAPENPVMLLVIKPEIINSRQLSIEDQERVLQECVDEVSPLCFSKPAVLTFLADTRKQCSYHKVKEHACRSWQQRQRYGVETAASAESMHHDWPYEEGDREGWCHHTTCDY